jgi:hypothetical protein
MLRIHGRAAHLPDVPSLSTAASGGSRWPDSSIWVLLLALAEESLLLVLRLLNLFEDLGFVIPPPSPKTVFARFRS